MMISNPGAGTHHIQISFIQCNLNHFSVAQHLVLQYMTEEKIDIALFTDTYRVSASSNAWLASYGLNKAAIYIASDEVTSSNVIVDPEFISARINGVQVYNAFPNSIFYIILGYMSQSHRTYSECFNRIFPADMESHHRTVFGTVACNSKSREKCYKGPS